jgi:hypothetical protein
MASKKRDRSSISDEAKDFQQNKALLGEKIRTQHYEYSFLLNSTLGEGNFGKVKRILQTRRV